MEEDVKKRQEELKVTPEDDGQHEIEGGFVDLDKLARGDPSILQAVKPYQGVLQRIATAIEEDKDYRQALYMADFISDEQASRFAGAIAEAKRYGGSITMDVDWLLAQCAVNRKGVKSNRVNQIIEAMTHFKYTTNMPKDKRHDNSRSTLT